MTHDLISVPNIVQVLEIVWSKRSEIKNRICTRMFWKFWESLTTEWDKKRILDQVQSFVKDKTVSPEK